jgi:hypothetical protein
MLDWKSKQSNRWVSEIKKMKRLIQWVREFIKRIIRIIRQWLNRSRLVLGIVCLIIGWTSNYIYIESQPYIRQIEIYISEQKQGYAYANEFLIQANDDVVQAGSHEALERIESQDSLSGEQDNDPSSRIIALIRSTFPENPDLAVEVARCESSLDPSRIGDTHMAKHSYGLFQINQTWHKYDKEILLNAEENIKIARTIYDSTGNWDRWTCGRRLQ